MSGGNETTRRIRDLLVAASNEKGEAAIGAWHDAILLDDGSDDEALGDPAMPPFRLRPYILVANELQKAGDTRGALAILEPIQARWPNDSHLNILLGKCYAVLEQWQLAADAYERSCKLAPSAATSILFGSMLDKLGRYDDALQALIQALVIDPNYEEAHYNLGWVLERTDIEGAIARYRRAIELDPDYQLAHARIGPLLVRTGQHDEARAHLIRAVGLDPADGWSHAYLGTSYQGTEQWPEAEPHLREAVRLLPAIGVVWSALATVLSRTERITEAEAAFAHALELDPDDKSVRYSFAEYLGRIGKHADARTEMRAAARLGSKLAQQWLDGQSPG